MNIKTIIAWCLTHWDLVSGIIAALCYAWLNARNARTAVEKRGGSKLVAIIDRLAMITMKGAQNKLSIPLLGQSIAEEAKAILVDQINIVPEPPDASGPVPAVVLGDELGREGFVDSAALRYLAVIALCLFAACAPLLSLASCASFSPQFRMVDPELITDPKFGECARTGTTLQAGHTQFAMLASVCVQRVGDAGVMIDPPEEPVAKDAGVVQLEADAQETDQ